MIFSPGECIPFGFKKPSGGNTPGVGRFTPAAVLRSAAGRVLGENMPSSIRSRDNDKVKWAARLVAQSRFRRESGLFVLEGLRLCLDAVRTGRQPEAVFYTPERRNALGELLCVRDCYEVTGEVFAKISDTKSPQGVLCVLRQTPPAPFSPAIGDSYALLDRVQDPSNLGAIARTAEALGVRGLLVSGDGCDAYSPKAQRAGMGSLLRLPVWVFPSLIEPIGAMRSAGVPVFAAVPDAAARQVSDCDFSAGAGVVIGNEANGLRDEIIACCDARVTIPMAGRAESLNAAAAAAILLWEITRQQTHTADREVIG